MLKRHYDRYYQRLLARETLFFAVLLAVLQVSIWSGVETFPGRMLFVIHIGLFILWQPFFHKEIALEVKQIVVSFVLILVLVITLNHWSVSGWIILLIGALSGQVGPSKDTERSYLVLLGVLLCDLLLFAVPGSINEEVFSEKVEIVVFLVCLAVPIIYAALHKSESEELTPDLLQSINTVLFVFFISMGVLVVHAYFELSYLGSLITWLMVISVAILLLFWLMFPSASESGMRYLIENYLLRLNHSSENWLNEVTDLAYNKKFTPDSFLDISANQLTKLPWIKGVRWKSESDQCCVGESTNSSVEHEGTEYSYQIYSDSRLGPTLQFHAQWLLKLLDLLVVAKVREYRLAQQSQLKAIYETGAKLTHDIKNILQAFGTLMQLVEEVDDDEALPLIRQQLPTLSHRLEHTIAKLNAPALDRSRVESLIVWWRLVQARYAGRDIDFECDIHQLESLDNDGIYIDVLDSVVENLLENARYKRQSAFQEVGEGGQIEIIRIVANLTCSGEGFSLTVTDEGAPIPEEKSEKLFNQAIESEKGYGIGLYQCAKSARRYKYQLVLKENRQGSVKFEISGRFQL